MMEAIWFVLWGILWAIYFMLDGFDLGIGMLLPFQGKTDAQRRAMLHVMGPHWDGNEVWLITAGGVTFAAFPGTYAVMFSALYSPLLLILFGLIFRGIAVEFRSQLPSPSWRKFWDFFIFAGSLLPALLLGVAFANIFAGVPIDADGIFQGTILTLLNPYGLLGGLLFVLMFLVHGALWTAAKTKGVLQERMASVAAKLWPLEVAAAVAFLVFSALATNMYDNYLKAYVLFLIPLVTVAALLGKRIFVAKKQYWKAAGASTLSVFAAVLIGVAGLFPNLLPSSLDPGFSMTIYNSSSSPLTLRIMLGVALVFVPIVIIYQAWSYKFFSDAVSEEDMKNEGY